VQVQRFGATLNQAFVEDYTYTPAGLINGKTVEMRTTQNGTAIPARTWTEAITYDAYVSPVTVKYPDFDNGDGTRLGSTRAR
jgi:hypothetical protein